MADIFISYAREDEAYARALGSLLGAQGWTVWWDRRIPLGRTYAQVIARELEIARCVVVLWSSSSVESDWVQNEAAEGAERRILIPILIERVRLPFEFRRLQALSLTDWRLGESRSELDELIVAVAELLGTPTQGLVRPPQEPLQPPQPKRVDVSEKGDDYGRKWRRLEIVQAGVAGLAVVTAIVTSLLLALWGTPVRSSSTSNTAKSLEPPAREFHEERERLPVDGTPLQIQMQGLIALVPAKDIQGGASMTALLVDTRVSRSSPEDKCFSPYRPSLKFIASPGECVSAGCSLTGSLCVCSPSRQDISISFNAKPAQVFLAKAPTHPLPMRSWEAGSFAYIANLARPPLSKLLDARFLGSVPPGNLLARMQFPFESVTACDLSSRSDKGNSVIYPMGFWPLHSPPQEEIGQALAQSAVFRLTIPKNTDVKLAIKDFAPKGFDETKVHFLKLKPMADGYTIWFTNLSEQILELDDPCAGDVDRDFAFFYDLTQNPQAWRDRPIPHAQYTQSASLKALTAPGCPQSLFTLRARGPISAMASFNP